MVVKENQNPNKTARIAGLLYLTMVPLGFFGMYGHSNLMVPGEAATTVNNIMASESLFRLSIMSALVGCLDYLIDSVRFFFFPSVEPIVLYTFWGELLLPLWLLIKGVNVKQWEKTYYFPKK